MPEKYKSSGLMLHELTVKPYSMATVEFLEVKPNYFRVQNFGDTRIYCGTSRTPTENNYDFACKPDGMFMYAEPNTRSFLYIYNPSGNETRVKVVAFAHDFDPLALVFSGIELDFSGTKLEADTAISSFNASLPSGTNNIGSVSVSSLPAAAASVAKQNEMITALNSLLSNLKEVYRQEYNDHVSCFHIGPVSEETIINGGAGCVVHFLTNDGETDLYLNFTDHEGGNVNYLALKPGESISDFKFWGRITVSGSNFVCRAMVSYPFA